MGAAAFSDGGNQPILYTNSGLAVVVVGSPVPQTRKSPSIITGD
jgi:hypothetical protein